METKYIIVTSPQWDTDKYHELDAFFSSKQNAWKAAQNLKDKIINDNNIYFDNQMGTTANEQERQINFYAEDPFKYEFTENGYRWVYMDFHYPVKIIRIQKVRHFK